MKITTEMDRALRLRKVALRLMEQGYYSLEDYAKFCYANNLLLF